jgi:phosphodiesterase/alkaline phosphatase D-like protein
MYCGSWKNQQPNLKINNFPINNYSNMKKLILLCLCLSMYFIGQAAPTPTYIMVTGISTHPDANGVYTKQIGTLGTLKDGITHLGYWKRVTSNGTFYIYADAYSGTDFWNIDNNTIDDDDILDYAKTTPLPSDPTTYEAIDWASHRGNKAVLTIYTPSAPTITSISPTSGSKVGATSVIITGTNLTAATAVKFGSTNATSYTVNSDTQITATSPAGSAGAVDVTVTTAGGTSPTSTSDKFTYFDAPTTISVVSTAGGLLTAITTAGGDLATVTNLTITGTIDARDFKAMFDNMTLLAVLDMSAATIAAYTDTEGTMYPANEIPKNAFKQKYSLTSLIMPATITSIGSYAFYYCLGLTGSLIIPSSVTTIGDWAFFCCPFLNTLVLEGSLTSVGAAAFAGFDFTTLSISASCTSIVSSFIVNKFFNVITLDENNPNYSLVDGVLFNKDKTILIKCQTSKDGDCVIPSTVTSIENNAFGNCSVLFSVDASNPKYSSADGVLFNKDKTRLMICPPTITGDYVIPSTVTSIENNAFRSCRNMTSLTIPKSMINFGLGQLMECWDLQTIYAYRTTPIEFMPGEIMGTLHVPVGYKDAFLAANFWMDTNNIIDDLLLEPTITGVSPTSGPTGGGTTVTITGTNLTGATSVKFGSTAATITTNTATSITATSPAGAAGAVDITVTTAGGTSATSSTDMFTYVAPPSISYTTPQTFTVGNVITALTPANTGGVVTAITGKVSTFATGLGGPYGVAADTEGNLYAAGEGSNKIFKITAAGVVTTLAGSGSRGSSNGTGTAASFNSPTGVAVDAAGNVYVADAFNNMIRKITADGVVTTLAGNTTPDFVDGTGTAASFNFPLGVAVDASGNVYVGEWRNNTTIRKITLTGYSISPSLPTGLSLDGATGSISGIPTVTSATKSYTITAANASGSSTTNLNITVNAAPAATTVAASSITSTGATLNGSVNANNASTAVSFEYGLTISYGSTATATQSPLSGSTATAVSSALTGLVPNTTYHYRVNGVNTAGTTNGTDLTFTTSAAAPTATTSVATAVSSSYATLNGSVNANNASTTVSFEYGYTTSYGTTVAATQSPVTGTTATSVSIALSGLVPNSTFHFRVKAVNTAGTTYGNDFTFTTPAIAPTAATKDASSISSTMATLNGAVNPNNATTVVTFEYGTTTSYGSSATATQSPITGSSATSVSARLTELTPNAFYHFRLKTVNTAGTTYGNDFTFTTPAISPAATTSVASSITTTGATLNGTVNANNASTAVSFEYGLTTSYGSSATAIQSPVTGTTATAVTYAVSGLVPNTTYHFRVKGVNTAGTTNGTDLTFTTSAATPAATTAAASSITTTGATLNGTVNANNASTAVTFEYGLTTSYGTTVTAIQSPVTGTTATAVSYALPGLVPNTTYHFRVKGVNTAGTTNGTDLTFTTSAATPAATTVAASSITTTGATLNGTVNANNASTTVTFEYGLTTSYGTTVTAIQSPVTGTTATAVSYVLPGLVPNTTYHFRVKGVNTAGTTNGTDLTFTTLPDITYIITTPKATTVKLTTATLGATIAPAGEPVTERGIYWSTSPGVTTSDNQEIADGTTGGTFTVDVTNLDHSSTIYYKGYVITPTGATILSEESNFSNVPIFTGTGNWEDAERWNIKEVPNGGSNNPVIDGICTITNSTFGTMDDGLLLCSNLTINSGARLTLNAAQIFAVLGTITNPAGAEGLIIKADPALPNASFYYFNNTLVPHVKASVGNSKKSNEGPLATVEMYSKASWDLSQPAGSKFNWQYFGIPVKTMAYGDAFSNCIVRKQYEASADDGGLWKTQGPDSVLTSGTGYEITQATPTKYSFKGELTNADFSVSLPYTMGAKHPGQYVLGNPYTSAIDITSIQFGDNTENSVYLYNTGSYNNSLSYTSSVGNAPGQYTVSTPQTAGTDLIPAQIPSMQGFLVRSINESTGSIDIPSYVNWGPTINTDMQRAPRKAASAEKVFTRIDVSSQLSADRMWIFTDSGCTRTFDNGWDGYKMMGSVLNPQLFAMEADGNYQIDAVNDLNETCLGFQAGQDKEYRLKFTHQNTASVYGKMYLVDMLTGKTTDISADGSEYTFTAETTPAATKRFKIVTTPTENQHIADKGQLKVYNSDGVLYIQNFSNQRGEFTLYDVKGLAVKRVQFEGNKLSTFSTQGLIPGAYVGKAETATLLKNEKLIIR